MRAIFGSRTYVGATSVSRPWLSASSHCHQWGESQQLCRPRPRHVNTIQCITSPPSIAASTPPVSSVSSSPPLYIYRLSRRRTILHCKINPFVEGGQCQPPRPTRRILPHTFRYQGRDCMAIKQEKKNAMCFQSPRCNKDKGGGLTLVYLDAYLVPCPKGSQGLKDTTTYKLSYDVVEDSNLFGSDVVATYLHLLRI